MPWAYRLMDRQHAGYSDECSGLKGRMGNLLFQVWGGGFRLSLIPWLGRGEMEDGLGISKSEPALNSAWERRKRSHRRLGWHMPPKGFQRTAVQVGWEQGNQRHQGGSLIHRALRASLLCHVGSDSH